MNLILCDCNPILCTEWEKNFRDEPKVQIVCGDFKSVPEYDCIVSPANSFGIMDGGLDLALINYFGNELMKRVQDRIKTEYAGEQPVGTCLIVETGNKNIHTLLIRQLCEYRGLLENTIRFITQCEQRS